MDHRVLVPDDADEAAGVLSSAFFNDPLMSFMLPRPASRWRALAALYRPYCGLAARHGRLVGVGTPLDGVACWEQPDAEMPVDVKALGSLLPLLATAYPLGFWRARPVFRCLDELHARLAPGGHYYLDNLGVRAEARRSGVASTLIRPYLVDADARELPVYTDTVTEANVAIYEHFGFVCVAKVSVPRTGITVYALLRP